MNSLLESIADSLGIDKSIVLCPLERFLTSKWFNLPLLERS